MPNATKARPAPAPSQVEGEWISARRAAKIIGCNYRHIAVFALSGRLTYRRLPIATRSAVKYLRADCERMARESVTPATATAAQSA